MPFLVQQNISLADFTTFKIGGAARFFIRAQDESDVAEAVRFAALKKLKTFVLGGGSNVLISDEGFDGLVLQIALKGISILPKNDGNFHVTAQAGEDWEKFVEFCVERNLQGVECLSGIPGLVGGTPVQNVGAYGQEVSETIVAVKVLERASGEIFEMNNAECEFAYRTSVFNRTKKKCLVVLSVTFNLIANGEPKITYKDLQNFFVNQRPTLKEARQAVLQVRKAKSMVIDAQDPNSKSAGSFFKNPIIGFDELAEIQEMARNAGIILSDENIPKFIYDKNSVKIPAAWLIEKSGFQKGFRLGRVGLSSNHTLAIVNLGGATASDVLVLKDLIQSKVAEKFGVELTPEPVFVGF